MENRYLTKIIREKSSQRMVFLGGPRQVGKSTLALDWLGASTPEHPGYLNWDYPGISQRILDGQIPLDQTKLVFDEIHKYAKWRGLLKGLYDVHQQRIQFLATGSARLDFYRHGGDSLFGRYQYFRLHPLSVNELNMNKTEDLETLLRFGGFPEPFFSQNQSFLRTWQKERQVRVIDQDLQDLEEVREVGKLKLLAKILPFRVGSPLSIPNLRQDLEVDYKTIQKWLEIFERLYICFRIAPYGPPEIKAVKKEQKLFLWDWSPIEDPGSKFENLVACQLLKYCHYLEDTEGFTMELRYLKNIDGKELDFVVLQDGQPLFAVECKKGHREINKSIEYFRSRTKIPKYYQVHLQPQSWQKENIDVLHFFDFCRLTNMP